MNQSSADGGPPMLGADACTKDGDGDSGGDEASPSTWSKMAYSAGEAGDVTFRFFLDLVIIGEMTGPSIKSEYIISWILGF